MRAAARLVSIFAVLLAAGYAATPPTIERTRFEAQTIEKGSVLAQTQVDPALQNQIFAIDPERVSESDAAPSSPPARRRAS